MIETKEETPIPNEELTAAGKFEEIKKLLNTMGELQKHREALAASAQKLADQDQELKITINKLAERVNELIK